MVKLLPKNPRIRFVSPWDPNNKVHEYKIDSHGKIINNDFPINNVKTKNYKTNIEPNKGRINSFENFQGRSYSCPAHPITPPYLKPKYQITRPVNPCDNNHPDYSEFANFMFSTETPSMEEYNI